jgi:hypothetical protein
VRKTAASEKLIANRERGRARLILGARIVEKSMVARNPGVKVDAERSETARPKQTVPARIAVPFAIVERLSLVIREEVKTARKEEVCSVSTTLCKNNFNTLRQGKANSFFGLLAQFVYMLYTSKLYKKYPGLYLLKIQYLADYLSKPVNLVSTIIWPKKCVPDKRCKDITYVISIS